jgi:membrane fusion protein, multidrug efflux system
MRPNPKLRLAITLTTAALTAGYLIKTIRPAHAQSTDASTQPAPEADTGVATVTTAPVTSGNLIQTLKAYGTVTSQPGAIAVYSALIESRVTHIRVDAGQPIAKGDVLAETEPSADSRMQMQDAENALAAAKKNLADVQQRIEIQLATAADLLVAQQALQSAQFKFDDLRQRGAAAKTTPIKSTTDGIISKVDAEDGQIIPAGAPIVELLARKQIEVRLGFEPAIAATLKPGQSVRLFPTGAPPEGLPGKIRAISQRINPDTRLVDVFVTPDSENGLLMDDFVRGEIDQPAPQSLLAPRDAVFPGDTGQTLFTVKDGHAVQHTVTLIAQTDKQIAFTAAEVSPGDQAVVAGSLELEDGMPVNVEAAQ